jgi:chorismate mutase
MQSAITKDSSVVPQPLQVDKLLQLIEQRLILQHDVARWKWNHKRSIEAPQREQELLAQLREQAATYNLSPDAVSAFFQWQIQAGKLIQIADFQSWHKQGIQLFDNVPDLNLALRPLLDELDVELLSALAELTPVLGYSTTQELIESHAKKILHGEGINETVRRVAIAPLLDVSDTPCQSNSSFFSDVRSLRSH